MTIGLLIFAIAAPSLAVKIGHKKLMAIGSIIAVVNKDKGNENLEETKIEKLIMVTEAGFAPYEFYDGEEIVGVDVEIAKKIAEKTGKELEIKDTDFDSIINEVKTGKADFAAAGLSITEERLEEVDFSIEYAISSMRNNHDDKLVAEYPTW